MTKVNEPKKAGTPAKRNGASVSAKIKQENVKIEPYIGNLDDPNLDDFVKDNKHIKTGYRICFHTYWETARTLFMIHNETLNVWSHLIGALFFSFLVFYVLIYLHPTSLHENEMTSLVSRWSQDFDQGRFDDLYCDREDFEYPIKDQCPYKVSSKMNKLLDDILETDKLLEWHGASAASQKPTMVHTNLNYHASAYEKVDHYLRNALNLLTNPPKFFEKCIVCAKDVITGLPQYLSETILKFEEDIDDCTPPVYPMGMVEEDTENKDHHCKTKKKQHIEVLLGSIKERISAWIKYAEENPSVQTIQALFSQNELDEAARYVPRWPLFVHIGCAIIMMSCSSYYHLFLCENSDRYVLLRCFDMIGICFMICGSTTPGFYYGHMCEEHQFWGWAYLIQVYVTCFIAMFVTLALRNDGGKYNWVNAAAFIFAGWSTAPGIINLSFNVEDRFVKTFPLWAYVTGGVMYTVGGTIYALKIPECFFENKFTDIWFNSHSFFHWMILGAAMLHMWASFRVFHERQLFPCPEAGHIPTSEGHFSNYPGFDEL